MDIGHNGEHWIVNGAHVAWVALDGCEVDPRDESQEHALQCAAYCLGDGDDSMGVITVGPAVCNHLPERVGDTGNGQVACARCGEVLQ